MEAIDTKKMLCCQYIIQPKISTRQKPYIVSWKCPKCGERMRQKINGDNLLVIQIAESIDANKALPNI